MPPHHPPHHRCMEQKPDTAWLQGNLGICLPRIFTVKMGIFKYSLLSSGFIVTVISSVLFILGLFTMFQLIQTKTTLFFKYWQ